MFMWKWSAFAVASLIVAGLTTAPPAHAGAWQAIFASNGDGVNHWGTGEHWSTKQDAEAAALKKCQSGASDCRFAVSSMECVALVAEGSGHWSGGWGPDASTAVAGARITNGGRGDVIVTRC
jgi:hypothetical protein